MGAHNACNLVNRVPVNISHQQVCLRGGHGGRSLPATTAPEEVRHASRNADSAYLFCIACDGKKRYAESAFRDACRTSSATALTNFGRPVAAVLHIWSTHLTTCNTLTITYIPNLEDHN